MLLREQDYCDGNLTQGLDGFLLTVIPVESDFHVPRFSVKHRMSSKYMLSLTGSNVAMMAMALDIAV